MPASVPSRPPQKTYTSAPSSAPRSIERIALPIAARRTRRSFEVKAPSLNAAWPNRFVVAMPTVRPVSSSADLKPATMRSRSAAEEPHGTRSSSCRLTPHAPSSASLRTESTGSIGSRVGPPNGSRPGLPTVHRPNVNLCSRRGVRASSAALMDFSPLGRDWPRASLTRAPNRRGVVSFRAMTATASFGLDVGTSSVKGVAVGPDGVVLAVEEAEYGLSTPRPGWAEQDPHDWWRATETVLANLRERAGAPAGIGLAGQMHGLVALDAAGEVVRPAILWNDGRTGAECAEIEERVGLERLIALTGNRAMTGFTAPKLLWLRRHEPDSYGRIARIMLPKDYVRLRLTGEWATDVADASGTLLLDVAKRTWSGDVLDALELPSEWLPPVLESPELSGRTIGGDELSQGIPVAAGAGDCASAAIGVGIDRPGPLSITMGTSGVVFAALPAFASDAEARVHAFCHAVPEQWHAMGVMLSAAGSLQWLHDRLAPETPFSELLREAEAWGPGAEGLLFAPYLAGERTPHADPSARAAFTGLELRHDRGALVRAVLEGVAFGLRDSLELIHELGVPADRARASGGGARGLWLEIVASVLGLPIELTAVEEGSAYGAALLGGVAAGTFTDVRDAVARCVRVRTTVEPDPDWQTAYDDTYARFRALYPALDTLKLDTVKEQST